MKSVYHNTVKISCFNVKNHLVVPINFSPENVKLMLLFFGVAAICHHMVLLFWKINKALLILLQQM